MLSGEAISKETNWYAKGLKAEFAGDYQSAIENYKKSAYSGVNEASFAIGRVYKSLNNDSASLNWFLESAKAGNKLAQYELGLIYSYGSSAVSSDREEAIKWLSFAANAGVGEAAYELFKLLKESKYLLLAADKGVSEAILELVAAYEEGLYDLEVDISKSERWNQIYTDSVE